MNEERSNRLSIRRAMVRTAAAGKAFIVYLGTGSIGVAILAYIIFKVMGC